MRAAASWLPFFSGGACGRSALAVVSHAHADHLGGLPSVMARLRTGLVIEPGADVADPTVHAASSIG